MTITWSGKKWVSVASSVLLGIVTLFGLFELFLHRNSEVLASSELSFVSPNMTPSADQAQNKDVKIQTAGLLTGSSWTSNGPYGASIRELVVSPNYAQDKTVFAGSWGSGIFKLDDHTGMWTPHNSGMGKHLITALAVSPVFSDDHTVFAATCSDNLYVSTDAGTSWVTSSLGLPLAHSVYGLAISPAFADDRTVFAGVNNWGAYRSQDGGASWSPIATGLEGVSSIVDFEIAPTFDVTGVVYGLSESGDLYRTDDGENWTSCTDPPGGRRVTSMAMTPDGGTLYIGTDDSVYTSIDQCALWSPVPGYDDIRKWIDDIAVSPDFGNDQTLWVANPYGGIYSSTNAGADWFQMASDAGEGMYALRLAVSPSFDSDRTVFAGSLGGRGGVYRITGADGAWHRHADGMTWCIFDLVFSPDYSSDQTVYAGLNGGAIFRSQDRGISWEPASTGYPVGADAAAVEPSPQFAQDNTLFAAGYGTGIYRSQDRGASWSQVGLTNVYGIREIAISPGAALTQALILAGSDQDGVYRSADGGQSWTPITQELTISTSHAIAFSPAYTQDQTIFVGADDGNGLYRSVDGGLHWTRLVTGLEGSWVWAVALSPNFARDDTALVVISGNLFRSQDRGDSWSKLSSPGEYDVTQVAFSPNYANDQTLWMGATQWKPDSEGGVFVSQDSGDTWHVANLGLPDRDIRLLKVASLGGAAYDVFVGTQTRSVWRLSTSDEMTRTWTVMVYLNGDNNLDGQTFFLFNRLEKAVAADPSLTIQVLWDRSGDGDTVLYHVQPDTREYALANYVEGQTKWSQGELDMGDRDTLLNFITTSRQQHPSTYTLLSVVNHGGGWSPKLRNSQRNSERWFFGGSGFSWDETNNHSYLSTQDMGYIFSQSPFTSAPVDVVFYDACLMGMLEEAYEIHLGARLLVASENETWSSFPYDTYLENIQARTPETQAMWMVNQYHASLSGFPRTMAVIDLDRTAALSVALDNLAVELNNHVPTYRAQISEAFLSAQKFDYNYDLVISDTEGYVDLWNFAAKLIDNLPGTALATQAQNVQTTLKDPVSPVVVYELHESGYAGWHGPYVDLNSANGLSVYLPLGEPDRDLFFYINPQLALAYDTLWDEFLLDFLGIPYPGAIPDSAGGRGNQPYPRPLGEAFLPIIIRQ